jgi:hypothetical protein
VLPEIRAGIRTDTHSRLTRHKWLGFIDQRLSGAIDFKGIPIKDEERRKAVRPGTVGADLVWLKTVPTWATKWQDDEARYVMVTCPPKRYHVE